jgi:hypothetical protein
MTKLIQSINLVHSNLVTLLFLSVSILGTCMASDGDTPFNNPMSYTLDTHNPVAIQFISQRELGGKSFKFIKIEVMEVVNPNKIPVSFSMHYHQKYQENIFLGTFSLFPPDNPGSFIIATSGKLQNEGCISLTLVPLESITSEQQIQVTTKPFSFVEN